MGEFNVKPPQFRKIRGDTSFEAAPEPAERVEMIVSVAEEGYVPAGVTVRGHIDSTMFTAEAQVSALENLENDPKVKSISISRPLRIID